MELARQVLLYHNTPGLVQDDHHRDSLEKYAEVVTECGYESAGTIYGWLDSCM